MTSDVVAAVLKRLDLPDAAADPQTLLRQLHRAWKTAGGTYGGKPRHSDRFLAEQLKTRNTVVRSLTPKLAGTTKIKPQDAEFLSSFFLSSWPKDADSAAEDLSYEPLLPPDDAEEFVDFIVEGLEQAIGLPQTAHSTLPGEGIEVLLRGLYGACDALFTVATESAVVRFSNLVHPMHGFRKLITEWWEVEQVDDRPRPLIWIADIGRKTFDDPEPAQRFLSLYDLVTRIKALRDFDDRKRDERFHWLERRAVFVVLDTRFEQDVAMAGFRRPTFLPHHVSFSAIPPEWAKTPNFRALYGSELDRLTQRTFTVAYKAQPGWQTGGDDEEEQRLRRYFGHASFAVDTKPNSEQVGRSLELPSPGASYEEAYKTVYAATIELLGLKSKAQEPHAINGKLAIEQLKYLGFRLLRLEEFARL
jgi:hypothetical protein